MWNVGKSQTMIANIEISTRVTPECLAQVSKIMAGEKQFVCNDHKLLTLLGHCFHQGNVNCWVKINDSKGTKKIHEVMKFLV